MKLPNAHLAVVEREKIVDYLLNPAHRHGASKARFFSGLGFRVQAWETLAAVLREHGQRHDVARTKETGFGPRYEVLRGGGRDRRAGWPTAARAHGLANGRRTDCAASHHRVSSGSTMIKEHDCVVLTSDIPADGLKSGDVGTVVHIHKDGVAYEVEFITLTGQTVAVSTVLQSQCRPISQRDISHVRELAPT